MSPLLEVLEEIRRRPAIYIGTHDIVKLASYLRGFEHAVQKYGIAPPDPLLGEFRDWLAMRFAVTISQSWEAIFAFQTVDNRHALELFWKLLDEFLAERNAA